MPYAACSAGAPSPASCGSEGSSDPLGDTLAAVVREELAPLLAARPVGLTLQVDEGHEVFDAKHSNLHPLFGKPSPKPHV